MDALFRKQLTDRFISLRNSENIGDLDREGPYLRGYLAGLFHCHAISHETYSILMELTTNVWNNRFEEFCAMKATTTGVPF